MTGQAATETNTIEIRLSSIEQLFQTLDPSPFREKDLDNDVENFIVSWARELRTDLPFRIVVGVSGFTTHNLLPCLWKATVFRGHRALGPLRPLEG